MMPNSRLIPTTPTTTTTNRKRSNSAAPVYHQSTTKKGFMSRLLTKSNTEQPFHHEYRVEKKTPNIHQKNNGSIGKLFKKIGGNKAVYEDNYPETMLDTNIEDDLPKVRPIRQSRQYSKIPLAPPPTLNRHRTYSQPSQQFLSDLPDQYIVKRPTVNTTHMTNTIRDEDAISMMRKSSGSISIYSTFGRDSIESQIDAEISSESLDSFNTVLQHHTTPAQHNDVEEDEEEDEFVDANGFSQEDIELFEKKLMIENSNLSNRLSGGHVGSAGGLVVSIQPMPEDDELAQSLLNWKRHSGGNKRWSHISRAQSPPLPEEASHHQSTITVIDLRQTKEEEEEEEEELSIPDKMALRKEAEKALNGETATEKEETLFDSDVWTSNTEYNISLPEISPQEAKEEELTTDTKVLITEDLIAKEDDDQEAKAKETAQRLWNEDESIVSKEKMAEWLGQGKAFNSTVLAHYMQYFNFDDMRLDTGFRKLCSKLYFKAEAQQIDRILEAFANRYWECNTDCLLGSSDVVYAVVYSLLLLNTDLHVAQGKHVRMTRSEFIRNTMSTVLDQKEHEESLGNRRPQSDDHRTWEMEVESYLKEMYTSVKQYQILQPLKRKTSLVKRGSILGNRRVAGLKRSVNSIIRKSGIVDSMIIPEDFYPAIQPRASMSSNQTSPRRESFSSVTSSNTSFSSRCGSPVHNMSASNSQYQPMMIENHFFSSRPPYYKEGIVIRKHLLENASQKAKHREWKECYLEVGKNGDLCMYQVQEQAPQDKSLFRHSSAHFTDRKSNTLGGHTKWVNNAQLMGKIALNHTLSNPLPPPGYNRQRPHVFAIQQPDGGVYLFQTTSSEQAQEWVSTCNYWAARNSKEPLSGGVGNMEYGWSHCLDDVVMDLDASQSFYLEDPDLVVVQDWLPPTPSTVSSTLSEKEQYRVLQRYLSELNDEINEHRDRKTKLLIKFPSKCNNYTKVITNWEARAKYLLHEIIKYQNYCDALEKSIEQVDKLKGEQHSIEQEEDKLIYQTLQVDLFKEINQELHFNL
ncbi:hypothetical protein G6F64_006789 [Rhizopus arrhizus]|uniref:SEC7 domain-containing protein n=1 Tax=Rhizopus oryzae TaxID=64495 RepID=A0A9P6X8L9_RHIOR|nr:hypothetical protein G6F64_006789 [Rhizopus arrhizus]